jgi:hypothetical protein
VYLIVVAMQASIILPVSVKVKLSPDEVKSRRAAGGFILSDNNAYTAPKQSYLIGHNGFQYALNGNGEVRLDLTFSTFVMSLIRGSLAVDLILDGISSPKSVEITGFGNGRMFSEASGGPVLGALDGPPTTERFGPAVQSGLLDFIGTANAAIVQGTRLYLQSVTIPRDVNVTTIKASLTSGRTTYPLQALSTNLAALDTSLLTVKSGTSVVQDYRMFFSLPESTSPDGAKITFQSGTSLLGLGYSETFDLPDKLQLGTPVEIKGDSGTIIVVQLAFPVDVVFFQQLNTNATTDAMVVNARNAGYVPRILNTGAIAPASYNIIYAGSDVPIPAVRDMVRVASDARVELRLIQPQVKLTNGLQNQIQVGASPKVTCLPVISRAALDDLVKASSDSDFLRLIRKLPPATCS